MAITYKFEEVLKHNQTGDCWLVIDGKVYDLSPFMEDHPGGDEVLLAATGKDATNDFEDVGHSDSAREMMHQYCIGDVDPSTVPRRKILVAEHFQHSSASGSEFFIKLLQFLVPILILALAFAVRRYTKEN